MGLAGVHARLHSASRCLRIIGRQAGSTPAWRARLQPSQPLFPSSPSLSALRRAPLLYRRTPFRLSPLPLLPSSPLPLLPSYPLTLLPSYPLPPLPLYPILHSTLYILHCPVQPLIPGHGQKQPGFHGLFDRGAGQVSRRDLGAVERLQVDRGFARGRSPVRSER